MTRTPAHNLKNILHVTTNNAPTSQGTVTVKAEGTRVRVRIIGSILRGWSDDQFRIDVMAAKNAGAKDVEVYINSGGGDVFAASEIVNIIEEFIQETGGQVVGRGGAMVASAASFIAMRCSTFALAANGWLMIHKPTARIEGTADEVESAIKLLRGLEDQYAEGYAAKTGMTVEEIKALYDKGDYWIDAKESLDKKFIDSIAGEEAVTEETKAMFAACGRPAPTAAAKPVANPKANPKEQDKMLKLEIMAAMLGVAATEDAVNAEINRLRASDAELKVLKGNMVAKAAQEKAEKITAFLDKLVADKRIHADARNFMQSRLVAAENLEAEQAKVEAEYPVVRSIADGVKPNAQNPGADSGIPADRMNWDWKKWNAEDPSGLEALAKTNESEFLKLFNAHHKTNRTSL